MPAAHHPPLDPLASTPLWLQLKHALRDLVTFRLKDGDRIPSEAVLCRTYSVSRVTVRQAVTSLVDEGLLLRQQGRGTFVRSARITEPLAELPHLLRGGFDAAPPSQVSVFSVETVAIPEWIAARPGMAASGQAFKIRKLLAIEGEPVAARTSYVPVRLAPGLSASDLRRPLLSILEERFDLFAQEAVETMEFIIADAFRAHMLKVPVDHPLILVERIVRLPSGQAIECSRTFYKADRFTFRRVLRRPEAGGREGRPDQPPAEAESGAIAIL